MERDSGKESHPSNHSIQDLKNIPKEKSDEYVTLENTKKTEPNKLRKEEAEEEEDIKTSSKIVIHLPNVKELIRWYGKECKEQDKYISSIESDLNTKKNNVCTNYLFLYINKFKEQHFFKRNTLFELKNYDIHLKNDASNVIETNHNLIEYCVDKLKCKKSIQRDHTTKRENMMNHVEEDQDYLQNKLYLFYIYEIILFHYKSSFKIWYHYLKDSIEMLDEIYINSNVEYARINIIFKRCTTYVGHCKAIYVMYIQFLFIQRKISTLRETLSKGLQTLSVYQHQDLWDYILQYMKKIPSQVIREHFLLKYVSVRPDQLVLLFFHYLEYSKCTSAVVTYFKILDHEQDYDLHELTMYDLLKQLLQKLTEQEKLSPSVIKLLLKRMNDLRRLTNIAFIYIMIANNLLYNEKWDQAISIFKKGIGRVCTMEEFSVLYENYVEALKTIIEVKIEEQEELNEEAEQEEPDEQDEEPKPHKTNDTTKIRTPNMNNDKISEVENVELYKISNQDETESFKNIYMDSMSDEEDSVVFVEEEEMNHVRNIYIYNDENPNEIDDKNKSVSNKQKLNQIKSEILKYMNTLELLLKARKYLIAKVKLKNNKNNVYSWIEQFGAAISRIDKFLTFQKAIEVLSKVDYVGNLADLYIFRAVDTYKKYGLLRARRLFCEAIYNAKYRNLYEIAKVFCLWIELELKEEEYAQALELAKLAIDKNEHTHVEFLNKHNITGSCPRSNIETLLRYNFFHSIPFACLLLDLELNFGTVQTSLALFETLLHMKRITVKMVISLADYLYKNKYFNECFKTYEKGISVFHYPHVYNIYVNYITKYVEHYKGKGIAYARDLFRQAIYGSGSDNKMNIPPKHAKYIFLMYAKFEEKYGFLKTALNIYKEAIPFLEKKEKLNFYKLFVWKIARAYGVKKCREAFEEAIQTLEDDDARQMCLLFIEMETNLNEYERVRSLYTYTAQFTNPMDYKDFYNAWRDFEALYGNENTFREMIRIKRSVLSVFSKSKTYSMIKVTEENTTAEQEKETTENMTKIENVKKRLFEMILDEKKSKN